MTDDTTCPECGGGLAHPEDMAYRLADALRRVLYGAEDGTTHVERIDVAMEAVETYDRWHAKWSKHQAALAAAEPCRRMRPVRDPEPTGYVAHLVPREDGRWEWRLTKGDDLIMGGFEKSKSDARYTAAREARNLYNADQAAQRARRNVEPESFEVWTQ